MVRGEHTEASVEAKKIGGGRPAFLQNVPTPSRGGRAREAGSNGAGADRGGGANARGPASALEELMRRKGVDEAWTALEDMQSKGVATDKYTVSRMLMKTVGDGRTRLNMSKVYRGIGLVERFIDLQPKDVDEVLFNALLDTCCRLKDLSRLESTVKRMRELKVTPSPVTLGILVKTYGRAGDMQKVLSVWDEMESQRGQANAVTYGCMIDACVKCGHLGKAVEIFQGMRSTNKHRNTILYTTLIKGYGMEKDLKNALELFREMPGEGVPYNTITFNSIIDACIKCGDLALAEQLLRDMTSPGSSLEPDLITFSTLLKGYCHIGDLDKALDAAEAIKARGLRCDELVYNTLMDGCVKANDISAGIGIFEEMVQNGMKPSAITHSILARLCQRSGYEDDADELLAQLYMDHGIERPSGGDKSRNLGGRANQKWGNDNQRGNQKFGERGTNQYNQSQSSFGSPSAHHWENNNASWGHGWENNGACWGNGFDASPPSTPMSGNAMGGSPMAGNAPYLPMVPTLPGSGHSHPGSSFTPGSSPQAAMQGMCGSAWPFACGGASSPMNATGFGSAPHGVPPPPLMPPSTPVGLLCGGGDMSPPSGDCSASFGQQHGQQHDLTYYAPPPQQGYAPPQQAYFDMWAPNGQQQMFGLS